MSGPRKIHRNKALPVEERENSWESVEKRLRSVENCRPPFSCAKKKCQTCKMEIIDGRTAKDIQCPPRPIRPESQRTSRFLGLSPRIFAALFSRPLA